MRFLKTKKKLNNKKLDQFLTLEKAKIGPIFNSTAYIYIYIDIHIYLSISIYTYIYILFFFCRWDTPCAISPGNVQKHQPTSYLLRHKVLQHIFSRQLSGNVCVFAFCAGSRGASRQLCFANPIETEQPPCRNSKWNAPQCFSAKRVVKFYFACCPETFCE